MRSSVSRLVAIVLLCLPLAACATLIESTRGLTLRDVVTGGQPKRLFSVTTRGQAQGTLQHVQLTLDSRNPIWTPTGLTVAPGDLLRIETEGTVTIGPYHAEVNADGSATSLHAGALELKIAIYPAHLIGASGCFVADQRGEVLVRIRDHRYEDNAGTYEVRILRIPVQAVPAPRIVDP